MPRIQYTNELYLIMFQPQQSLSNFSFNFQFHLFFPISFQYFHFVLPFNRPFQLHISKVSNTYLRYETLTWKHCYKMETQINLKPSPLIWKRHYSVRFLTFNCSVIKIIMTFPSQYQYFQVHIYIFELISIFQILYHHKKFLTFLNSALKEIF